MISDEFINVVIVGMNVNDYMQLLDLCLKKKKIKCFFLNFHFLLFFEMYIFLSILLHCLALKDFKGESRNKCNTLWFLLIFFQNILA